MKIHQENILREFIRKQILVSLISEKSAKAGMFNDVMAVVDIAKGAFASIMGEEDEEDEEELQEEIGRNYRTIVNDPYSWKDNEMLDVKTYAATDGSYRTSVKCDDEEYDSGVMTFGDEEEAEHFGRMQGDKIIRMVNNKNR